MATNYERLEASRTAAGTVRADVEKRLSEFKHQYDKAVVDTSRACDAQRADLEKLVAALTTKNKDLATLSLTSCSSDDAAGTASAELLALRKAQNDKYQRLSDLELENAGLTRDLLSVEMQYQQHLLSLTTPVPPAATVNAMGGAQDRAELIELRNRNSALTERLADIRRSKK